MTVQKDTRIAEIVTFRLAEGVTDAAFLDAARAMQPFVEAAPGFVSRTLSKGEAGSWTDHVLWTSMTSARTAAETIFADPATAPFAAAIDAKSVVMRHEPVLFAPG